MSEPIQISLDRPGDASPDSPPAFAWDDWYAGIGGRKINIPEVDRYLELIHGDQFPRFNGPIADKRVSFASAEEASRLIKAKARDFGADIVGICEIEPSDIYRGRALTER